MGGSTGFVTRHFDPERGTWIQPTWITAPPDATLILDGEFLNRAELRGLWSWSMLVESDAAGERSTGETSTGESSTVETSAAAAAMQLYSAEDDPRSRSAAVVDVTDPDNPRRRFLDSC
jgi:uridine kinase